MKIRSFEFEDQSWFPPSIRNFMTDYLRFVFHTFKLYQPVLPILKIALIKTNTHQILDLCSGSGGAMEEIYLNLKHNFSAEIKITLTDLFPNLLVYKNLYLQTGGGISYIATPVNAAEVPENVNGFRTIFSGFHHFDPLQAQAVINDAVNKRKGIGIFDGGNRNLAMIFLVIIVHIVLLLICTPFFKPFRIQRLLFTYLIPIIPFCTIWDGIVSILRLYTPDEMIDIARKTNSNDYIWISGKVKNKFGMSIAYLVGYPTIENN